jgi:hypothetical protein
VLWTVDKPKLGISGDWLGDGPANVIVVLNKHKQSVAAEYNLLDLEAKARDLEDDEKVRLKDLAKELDKLWALDEIKARQRYRDRNILEGGRNTSYFHATANHRFRKKRIETLKGRDGLVHETDEILRIAADYYKDLFRKEDRGHFSLVENF